MSSLRFSVPIPTPQAPFFKPLHTGTYVACEFIKPGVELNPTFKLTTQAITGATPRCSKLGPQLNEPPHFMIYLERHVTLPHFRDVNIIIDTFPEWPPLVLPSTSFLTLLVGLATSWLKEAIHTVSLCFLCRRFNWMCFLFSSSALI